MGGRAGKLRWLAFVPGAPPLRRFLREMSLLEPTLAGTSSLPPTLPSLALAPPLLTQRLLFAGEAAGRKGGREEKDGFLGRGTDGGALPSPNSPRPPPYLGGFLLECTSSCFH